jgi:hypothetical protein
MARSGKASSKSQVPAPTKPSYAGFETHDLQKQISAFGFKPVKKREKMIELLERCWEEKHGKQETSGKDEEQLKQGDFLSNVHDVSSRPQPKVKKPRKRAEAKDTDKSPKKASQKRKKSTTEGNEDGKAAKKPRSRKKPATQAANEAIDIDKIALSEDTTAATVSKSSQRPTQPMLKTGEPTSILQDQSQQHSSGSKYPTADNAPDKIHTAILRQSEMLEQTGVNHQLNPTWHEKILLYDPIILEDLTAWLNVEGLGLVGEDGEVSALEVRDWCESNGICCLWKGGWRGPKANELED